MFKAARRRLDRRGISYGLVFILITVAALAVAAMLIGPMIRMGSAGGKQAVLQVVGTPIIQGQRVYLTVRNIGTVKATVTHVVCADKQASVVPLAGSGSGSNTVDPGASTTFYADFPAGTFQTAGQTYELTLITDQGTIAFTAYKQT